MDVAGDNQVAIDHDMFKQRLSSTGALLGLVEKEIVGEVEASVIHTESQKGEGCRVHGTMVVNKVSGNFHIAHGESIIRDGRHIHQFVPAEAPGFNVSHTIHHISFGHPYPKMPKNPLDGKVRVVYEGVGTGLYQYFIKIIPTVYEHDYGLSITNQYTVTERFRPLSLPGADGILVQQATVLPGIFFIYELSPFLIKIQKNRQPIIHFLTRLCAIIGGVYTVIGVVDSMIFRFQKLIRL